MLFTPGPTEIEEEIREIASKKLPYFRGDKYANMMLELTADMKYIFQTKSTPLTITSSGTGVMEMAIQNLLNPGNRVIVLNGGTFGAKWVEMCKAFGVEVKEVKLELGKLPRLEDIEFVLTEDVKALLVNAHETSTGLLYNIQEMGQITHDKGVLLIVDAISSMCADEFRMDDWKVDCAMVSSNKALACLPGLSFIAFSVRAWNVIESVNQNRCYFNAENYLNNIQRGMTPFTPAMIVTFQLCERIKMIKEMGLDNYIRQHAVKADAFRKKILETGRFSIFPERQTNALSAIKLPGYAKASGIVTYLKEKYDCYIAPNPTNNETYLRISHMGHLSVDDLLKLADQIEEACMSFRG